MGDDRDIPPSVRGWWQASDGLWYPPPAPPLPPPPSATGGSACPPPDEPPAAPPPAPPAAAPGCAQLPWLVIKLLFLTALLIMIVAFVVAVFTS